MRAKFGGVHAVVQCAGIATATKVLGRKGAHSLADFERVLRVNTVGTFNVLRLAAEQMAAQQADEGGQRGVIINTARCARCAACSERAAGRESWARARTRARVRQGGPATCKPPFHLPCP